MVDLETDTPHGKLRQGLMALGQADMGSWASGQGCGEALGRLGRDSDSSHMQSVARMGCLK